MAKNSELEQLKTDVEHAKMLADLYNQRHQSALAEFLGYRMGVTEALVSLAGKHIEFE